MSLFALGSAAHNHKYIIGSWRSKTSRALQSASVLHPDLQKNTATHAVAHIPLWSPLYFTGLKYEAKLITGTFFFLQTLALIQDSNLH